MEWNDTKTYALVHTLTQTQAQTIFFWEIKQSVWCTLRFKSPNFSQTPIENIVYEIWFCHTFVDFKLICVHWFFICTEIFSHWYDRITAIYDHFHWFHLVVSSLLVIKFYLILLILMLCVLYVSVKICIVLVLLLHFISFSLALCVCLAAAKRFLHEKNERKQHRTDIHKKGYFSLFGL